MSGLVLDGTGLAQQIPHAPFHLLNNNINTTIASLPVVGAGMNHPLIIFVQFIIKDPTSNKTMWALTRFLVPGELVAPVAGFFAAAGSVTVVQGGFANPPTPQVALDGAGANLLANVQNPLAANPIDIEIDFFLQIGLP